MRPARRHLAPRLSRGIVATGACYRAITGAYLGERELARLAGIRAAAFHSILWVTFISAFVAGLGLIACIIPGIYLWVAFAVPIPVLLTEGTKGFKALGRSRELVSGYWWRCSASSCSARSWPGSSRARSRGSCSG